MKKRTQSINEIRGISKFMQHVFGTLDIPELAERAKNETSSVTYKWLRTALFNSLGLESKQNPEYLIMTGCVVPFHSASCIVEYCKLCDRLAISYAFLKDTEYCSGLPMLYAANKDQISEAEKLAKEQLDMNLTQARALGVKGVVYLCNRGYTIAQKLFQAADMELFFYPDIVLDKLESIELQMKETLVGYYQGCWRWSRELNPNMNIDFERYRRSVEQIKGVTVIDLPSNDCSNNEARLAAIEKAEQNHVDFILTPCIDCRQWAIRQSKKIPVKFLPEIFLDALGVSHKSW
jgi:hypothetical protein